MQIISKKNIIVIVIAVIAISLSYFSITLIQFQLQPTPDQIQPKDLSTFNLVGVIFSLFTLLSPLLLLKKLRALLQKPNINNSRIFLFIITIFISVGFGPLIYGKILVLLGAPIFEFYYFFAASILGVLFWGSYMFKKFGQ